MNSSRFPALALSVLFAVGCFYAAFGTISVLAGAKVGYQLWWLELLVAAVCVWLGLKVFARVENRQQANPRADRGERAIWRLAYRKGWKLSVTDILEGTMLDESSALNALRSLEAKQQAKLEPDGTWTLLEPYSTLHNG
jgi:hypothetical protein